MKILSEYAKEHGIKYRAAWNRYKAGKIPDAYQDEFGKILIPENSPGRPEYTVCYARVSSSENKKNLETQAERLCSYCAAKGWQIKEVVKECASGLNDNRPRLTKLLKNPVVTRIVVEHKDRLTRFGFNYIKLFKESQGCRIEIINESSNDRDELMQDFVSLVTSFTARLYGLRRSKRKTEKLIQELENENKKIVKGND
ncbi:Resolvase N-terminal domain-containing protein [Desulfonema limicola]|uniref:Resolvase N-terminal domain-containing protein n=1 Tax=Desulfonema limicola TaxID=45656 RepID=A0A975BDD9_9BACT|nr:IS607 family transposase [Desulfonema limicola]QTA83238.1 Resolvase N-terminal domain-containing protein [Desulfonema limicola]